MGKRKYRRSSDGRFAGGGGGGSTASRGASAKPKQAVSKKKSIASAIKKKVSKMSTADKVRLATAAGYVAAGVVASHKSKQLQKQAGPTIYEATRYARNLAADRKGIGANKPGEGLTASKKKFGAYKIRSS